MIAVSVASGVAALLVGAAIYYFKRSSKQVLRCVCNATVSCMIARSRGSVYLHLHTLCLKAPVVTGGMICVSTVHQLHHLNATC